MNPQLNILQFVNNHGFPSLVLLCIPIFLLTYCKLAKSSVLKPNLMQQFTKKKSSAVIGQLKNGAVLKMTDYSASQWSVFLETELDIRKGGDSPWGCKVDFILFILFAFQFHNLHSRYVYISYINSFLSSFSPLFHKSVVNF